jgi:glycosyltransferase involved in cell wall biosynthesis
MALQHTRHEAYELRRDIMRIGILGPTYPYRGGIAHHTTLLFRHLKERHEVLFISFKRQYPAILFPGKSDRDPSSAPITEEGVEYLLDSVNPFTWLRVARRLRDFDPDIVVIPWWVAFWAPQVWIISRLLKRNRHTKILLFCHNVMPHDKNVLEHMARKLILKEGDYYVVQSSEEEEQLKTLLPRSNVKRVFHPTYDELIMKPLPENRSPRPPYHVLFFGFVRQYKGLKYLIEAISILRKDTDVRLTVSGEFWEDIEAYRRQVDSLGISQYVELLDKYVPNEEFNALFEQTDVAVLPYISVTGSGALQLALAFNKPVITTAIGSLSEVIIDGFNGFTVPPKDPERLADAIKKALDPEVHRKMVENIKADRHRFSWDSIMETIEQFQRQGTKNF